MGSSVEKPAKVWRAFAIRGILGAGLVAWAAFAFWLFSYSFSSSFFRYNQPSRLPPFIAACLGAIVIPVSGFVQWRRVRRRSASPLAAALFHVAVSTVALGPLVIVAAILAHAPEPWHPSADDAMGVGIDFLILVGIALTSVIVMSIVLWLEWLRARRE